MNWEILLNAPASCAGEIRCCRHIYFLMKSYTQKIKYFVSLPITNIKNPKTLLQVGEAYQAIGMLPEAVKFYEKVKILDSEKMYRDRIFLNLGKIHLKEKNFDDAILVGRSFIKNFPRSKRLNEAKKLIAEAHKENGL